MENGRPAAYITGIGIVSPIGVGRETFWRAMLAGESGAGPITRFDASEYAIRIACECNDFDPKDFVEKKAISRIDRFTQLGLASSKLALEDASAWGFLESTPERVGLVLGTGLGGVGSMEDTQGTLDARGPSRVGPFAVTKIMPNSGAANVGIMLGVQGPSAAPALACACGTDAMGLGYDLIRRGDADLVICGASEAPLTPTIVGGFISMRAMSRNNDAPEEACRPFDSGHRGFIIAEGSAMVILESEASVERRGAEPYAKITGFGRTTDAFNITDPDPEGRGIYRAMKLAVDSAGLDGSEVGYINPHGSGTPAGDGPESHAMARINPNVAASGTKSTLGHSLGASGAIETVITTLAVKDRTLPPQRNLAERAEDCAELDYIVDEPKEAPDLKAAICANLGVGGHNAAVAIERA
ncbi:3-oxoacyl-(acyl-carrier-protein) synthase [Rubrobacter radiotolerans]|uniref:3-oxoacyl-(Acyl-carrier-protein) synthase n=1 Tax=Rubrobacter radiotolerans TaxID=42256 RepID=A0A023X1V2_RUBRA|nr:beta-ketoacyl-[acyl-carrier-protein] synthase family protein [Rubrobacter radiotolerans]AHY46323.1 3-oxoacyl-(acyl-carrier-protein) synthase [Rubrobacter radiotolerans]MDX5893730.1 beta-ketoacyl-[acyl-carrier-protein] synthase family protein [Rubrobacter radiotolerans]SMC04376.1 3-oxoacyl-[acyl-carrier-protein] synthase II [Rubrobacter radiotolerans DSM 5868]